MRGPLSFPVLSSRSRGDLLPSLTDIQGGGTLRPQAVALAKPPEAPRLLLGYWRSQEGT